MTEESTKLPPLNFSEVEKQANDLREQASRATPEEAKKLKKEANVLCCNLCEKFIQNNSVDFTDLDLLDTISIDDLVFLYINLKYSNIENKNEIKDNIDSCLYGKMYDFFENLSKTDLTSLKKFLKYRLKELKRKSESNDYIITTQKDYKNFLIKIQKIENETSHSEVVISQADRPFSAPNLKEIEKLGKEYFAQAKQQIKGSSEEKKLRKQGNQAIAQGCFEYLQSINEPDWEKLSIAELVFLHKNTRFDRKNKAISSKLLQLLQQRLKNETNKIDSGELPKIDDIKALLDFCQYRSKDLKNPTDENEIFELSLVEQARPQLLKAKKRITQQINSESKKQAIEDHKEIPNSLAAAFEQVCDEKNIRYAKVADDKTIARQYNLYSQNAPENAEACGTLSIRSENNVDLQSDDQAHFDALAQAIKDTGAKSITIGELSPNTEKAKKFIAQLSLAGAKVGIKVISSQKFTEEELTAAYPDYAQAKELIRQRIERNKKRHYRNKTDKPKEAPSSEASYQTMPISKDRDPR